MKFTQQVKDNWLTNLKSGEYKQGFYGLVVNESGRNLNKSLEDHFGNKHKPFMCCIGVLGDCTEGLDNFAKDDQNDPYTFLETTIGEDVMKKIIWENDAYYSRSDARDYSNIIPIIEALSVQD